MAITIDCLPREIMETVMTMLPHTDVCSFAQTCKLHFQLAGSVNHNVWKRLFLSRWPESVLKLEKLQISLDHVGYEMYKDRITVCRRTRQLISQLSRDYLRFPYVSDTSLKPLIDFDEFLARSTPSIQSLFHYFVEAELMSILHDGKRFSNLTEKYYAKPALSFMRKKMLKTIFETIPHSSHFEDLENAVIYISKGLYYTTRCKSNEVKSNLDGLARKVLDQAATHRMFRGRYLKDMKIPVCKYDVKWTDEEYTELLKTASMLVIRNDGNRKLFANTLLGFEKYLAGDILILTFVLLRLGLTCEHNILSSPFHTHNYPAGLNLSCPKNPCCGDDDHLKGTSYGAASPTRTSSTPACPFRGGNSTPAANFDGVMRYLLYTVEVESATGGFLVLMDFVKLMVFPDRHDLRGQYVRTLLEHHVNYEEVMEHLDYLVANSSDPAFVQLRNVFAEGPRLEVPSEGSGCQDNSLVTQYHRAPTVQYAVGMVMKHKRYGYKCVIRSWDPICCQSDAWIAHMGVDELPLGQYQPFYSVLAADHTERYAAQENLEPCEEDFEVDRADIGRYFKLFTGCYYVPNAELAELFPHDEEAFRQE